MADHNAAQTTEQALIETGNGELHTRLPDYVKLEKNLTSLGFYSPSSKAVKKARPKVITLTREQNVVRTKARVIIEPSVSYGLPTTSHQDKTFAFQKLLQDRKQAGINIENPIGFHAAQILNLLDLGDSGENYRDLLEWLDVMTFTGIKSEDAIFHSGKRGFVKDALHVFERYVAIGKEMPDGSIADMNYVWLSEWMLDNIKNGYLVTVDFEAYKQLTNPVAKILVPLLQVWLYASQDDGVFMKRYSEFCQQVGIHEYKYLSLIAQKLSPALEELRAYKYLADWKVEKGAEEFNITLKPGMKYFADRRAMKVRKDKPVPKQPAKKALPLFEPEEQSPELPPGEKPQAEAYDRSLVDELLGHGLAESVAIRLATEKPAECRRQLELLPHQAFTPGKKAGFLRKAIEEGYGTPAGYLLQKQAEQQAARQKARQDAQEARNEAIVTRLMEMVEVLYEAHPEAFKRLQEFVRSDRDKNLRNFKPGTRLYETMAQLYKTEGKQLELVAEYFAQAPCSYAGLSEFIQEHTPERLKSHLRQYFEKRPAGLTALEDE
jgi:hypothetical protein